MKISLERLSAEAEATGFRPDMLEKVAHLLSLLDAIRSHPFLKGKLILKGGTALNLFVFDVPRLSVDIDLNYVGAEGREDMLAERPKIDKAVQAVFLREGFAVRRVSDEHAGCKWSLRFESAMGAPSNLEVDINFMFRIPLWQTRAMDSRSIGAWQVRGIKVMDIHELAAGKLAALLSRKQARDLFDVHQLLQLKELDRDRLRVAFVVYGAMNRKDWRYVSIGNLDFNAGELEHHLGPLLRAATLREQEGPGQFGRKLIDECRQALSAILPFTKEELEFLNHLLDEGEIKPSLLTDDIGLQDRIKRHPLLAWKALNVRQFRDGS
jgi:predicted nucleotidyltransferase component of viral defense system